MSRKPTAFDQAHCFRNYNHVVLRCPPSEQAEAPHRKWGSTFLRERGESGRWHAGLTRQPRVPRARMTKGRWEKRLAVRHPMDFRPTHPVTQ